MVLCSVIVDTLAVNCVRAIYSGDAASGSGSASVERARTRPLPATWAHASYSTFVVTYIPLLGLLLRVLLIDMLVVIMSDICSQLTMQIKKNIVSFHASKITLRWAD